MTSALYLGGKQTLVRGNSYDVFDFQKGIKFVTLNFIIVPVIAESFRSVIGQSDILSMLRFSAVRVSANKLNFFILKN